MSKNQPTTEELVWRDVVRQHMDSEWMSKMSSSEYREWEDAERMTFLICKYPEHEHDARLKKQIEFKEMEYELTKERILAQRKENKRLDKSINDSLKQIQNTCLSNNGLIKHEGSDICLGGGDLVSYDIAGNPGVEGAALTASTCIVGHTKIEGVVLQEFGKPNKNGRIYSPKAISDFEKILK